MAAVKRFVLFDLGGVLLSPGPQAAFQRLEDSLRLPRGFLQNVFIKSGSEGPFAQAERGQITFSKFIADMDKECKISADDSGVVLPESFSLEQAFHDMYHTGGINKPMLNAAITLRNHGFKTCVLTNNWIDDSSQRGLSAEVLSLLKRHFDLLIESCRIGMRKPEIRIYEYALKMLQAKPNETIFLDDIAGNLKPAREMGIATVLVKDTDTALNELQELSGIQLTENDKMMPTPANPENVTRGFVTVKPGVQLHFVEMGSGPVVCLCHGFPESWYSWRYQIPALVDAGFRVIALDMKGYGDSSAPTDIEEYCQEEICKDLVVFLDKLGIPHATFIGHDWGGAIVWNVALFYPERVRGVASLNTPFFPCDPKVKTAEKVKANPLFDYQLYFQEPGVAEAELEGNLERTFKVFFRGVGEKDKLPTFIKTSNVRERGGILVGTPEDPPLSKILGESELQVYVAQFKKSGFRGPLNWYRNMDKNWQWGCTAYNRKILVPALMVTAGKDKILLPIMTTGMEDLIPNLTRGHIEECGHWTQMERPAALNEILLKWLGEIHSSSVTSKL
ncbi:bifunctional epoxide hydrolase 2 isoform X2 [Ascaphus truei]|uniref:bifunctional epoxide hydrolase 2 isoform X2 n=2 Tax=Ascaphus truei TaxID=8439 RepID=UPI003F592F98